jgi:heme exporter protein D
MDFFSWAALGLTIIGVIMMVVVYRQVTRMKTSRKQ